MNWSYNLRGDMNSVVTSGSQYGEMVRRPATEWQTDRFYSDSGPNVLN